MKIKISKKLGIVIASLVVLSMCSSIAFAALYLNERMKLTGGVRPPVLSFALFDDDGVTPLERFDFPTFVAGKASNHWKYFYLNNTGDDSLVFGWNIPDTSITWTRAGNEIDGYYYIHEEAVDSVKVVKYEFEILVLPYLSPEFVRFGAESFLLTLGAGEGVPCLIRFTYWGKPETKETFNWQPNFFAAEAEPFPSD
jgi:hypothetical protein